MNALLNDNKNSSSTDKNNKYRVIVSNRFTSDDHVE